MKREYHKWHSSTLGREMELLVFGHAGTRMLVFPTRDGRFFEYEDMRMVQVLQSKIEAGELQLFCIDSLNYESFYCFWAQPTGRIQRHLQYESYIRDEILPFMDRQNPHGKTIAHGCSLGGFHAMNIALRHPQHFDGVIAFSGRYDLTLHVETFHDVFCGHYDLDIYFHTPSHFVPNLEEGELLDRMRQMQITLTIGDHDPFLDNNRQFSEILTRKGVAHAFYVWEGRAHSGYYWRRMAANYIHGLPSC